MHPTGSRISRVRYDTRSDRDNKVREIVSLCQLKPGEKGEVVEVKRAEKNALQRLLAMGVVPGSILKVEFASPVIVFQVENSRGAVDHGIARVIRVSRISRTRLKSVSY